MSHIPTSTRTFSDGEVCDSNSNILPLTMQHRITKSRRQQNTITFIRVATRFIIALIIILAFTLFYTFGLKDRLFHEKDGLVTKAVQSFTSSHYFQSPAPTFREFLPKPSHSATLLTNLSSSTAPNLPFPEGYFSMTSYTGRILQSTQEEPADEDEVERSCENIERLMHPTDKTRKLTSQEKCDFVDANCDENLLFKFYYCTLEAGIGQVWFARVIFYLISAYCVLLMFYLLADTADSFFSPALLKLSAYLRLPPNLAGVSLLALGSGSPDLCSTLASLINGNSDLAISVPIGAGVFVTSVVVGAVTLVANVKVSRRPFIRDVGSYLVAVSFIFFIYLDGRVRLFQGFVCFGIYVTYVLVVVIGRCVYQTRKKRRLQRTRMQKKVQMELQVPFLEEEAERDLDLVEQELKEMDELPRGTWFQSPAFVAPRDKSHELKEKDAIYVRGLGFIMNNKKGLTAKSISQITDRDLINSDDEDSNEEDTAEKRQDDESKEAPVITDYFVPVEHLERDDDDEEGLRARQVLCFGFDLVGWGDMSLLEKITFLLGGGITKLARNLTIPKSEPEEWNKWFACVSPILGTFFLLTMIFKLFGLFENWQWWMLVLWIIPAIPSTLFGLVVLFTAERKRPPIYNPILVTFAFFVCIGWIFFAADNLVKFLEVVGATLMIPPAVLGITVLAWGNSCGDMISNIVVARAGYATMAISAAFASPLLNALIGLGASFIFNSVKNFIATTNKNVWSGFCFEVPADPALTLSFSFLILILVSTLVCVPIMRFRIRKPYACWLFLLYFLYMVLAITASLVRPFGDIIKKVRFPTPDTC